MSLKIAAVYIAPADSCLTADHSHSLPSIYTKLTHVSSCQPTVELLHALRMSAQAIHAQKI